MKNGCRVPMLVLVALLVVLGTPAEAQPALSASAPLDIVTLKDGSILYGEVIGMEGGVLHLKTPTSPDKMMKMKWESIAKLTVNHPVPFHLKEGHGADRHGHRGARRNHQCTS